MSLSRDSLVALAAWSGEDLGKLELADSLLDLGGDVPTVGTILERVNPDDVPADAIDRLAWQLNLLREARGGES